ncbi:ABC transporter permease [Mesobacillus zeae]|uniref:ABC transporter permease n=1 Tax=Mesobacillus zeae TaxID=1917180 RepID=UPI00300A6490
MSFLKNKRQRAILITVLAVVLLAGVVLLGFILDEEKIATHLDNRNSPPSLEHLFGTDWLGRDMFTRTMMGLSLSMGVGLAGALGSTMIAAFLGMIAATMGRAADAIVSWLIDLFLSVPHLVTLILISFSLGGGAKGIIVGIALTHWPSLSRVIRAEMMQIRSAEYVQVSRRMGRPGWWIAAKHIFPHILPQLLVGFLLMFPHAILHEAAVTFLGMGLSPHQPAIGIILSESMKYLSSGLWWLAFFPGLSLLFAVRLFDVIGGNLRLFTDPSKTHEE